VPRKGARSRKTILLAAADLATVDGLDGLSLGALATHIGMSKSGLFAHFGSKEELQLATVNTAKKIFDADVIEPTNDTDDPPSTCGRSRTRSSRTLSAASSPEAASSSPQAPNSTPTPAPSKTNSSPSKPNGHNVWNS
jgi:AcrR family transcriptional regulator